MFTLCTDNNLSEVSHSWDETEHKKLQSDTQLQWFKPCQEHARNKLPFSSGFSYLAHMVTYLLFKAALHLEYA